MKGNRTELIWILFGVITVISGILLALNEPIGIAGSFVGVWLIADNIKRINNKKCQ